MAAGTDVCCKRSTRYTCALFFMIVVGMTLSSTCVAFGGNYYGYMTYKELIIFLNNNSNPICYHQSGNSTEFHGTVTSYDCKGLAIGYYVSAILLFVADIVVVLMIVFEESKRAYLCCKDLTSDGMTYFEPVPKRNCTLNQNVMYGHWSIITISIIIIPVLVMWITFLMIIRNIIDGDIHKNTIVSVTGLGVVFICFIVSVISMKYEKMCVPEYSQYQYHEKTRLITNDVYGHHRRMAMENP